MAISTKPNLFDYATGELSQDAFICWLLSWADDKYRESDPAIHSVGQALLQRLFAACNTPFPQQPHTVEIRKQYKSIDILALVDSSHAIIVEDKTFTKHHSGQLERYRETIAADFPNHAVLAIYLKTGDQSSYKEIKDVGYSPFLRKDLLEVLQVDQSIGIQSDIFLDFCRYLARIEQRVVDYQRMPPASWHWDCWTGFFIELQSWLGDGVWDYVPNPSGGFMGFWWHWRGNKYLQLENDKLCFKIEVEDKTQQAAQWESWHGALVKTTQNAPLSVVRPAHRRSGTWMTVAVLAGDYRKSSETGLLDMKATVELLRQAESLLDAAVAAGDS